MLRRRSIGDVPSNAEASVPYLSIVFMLRVFVSLALFSVAIETVYSRDYEGGTLLRRIRISQRRDFSKPFLSQQRTNPTTVSHTRLLAQLDVIANATDDGLMLNYTKDDFGQRVIIIPFSVELTDLPYPLQGRDLYDILTIVQGVIAKNVLSHNESFASGTTFGYVLLGDITAHTNDISQDGSATFVSSTASSSSSSSSVSSSLSNSSSSPVSSVTNYTGVRDADLMFTAGVVSFATGDILPSRSIVNGWVKEAVNSLLVRAMRKSRFSTVQSSRYVQLYNDDDFVSGNNHTETDPPNVIPTDNVTLPNVSLTNTSNASSTNTPNVSLTNTTSVDDSSIVDTSIGTSGNSDTLVTNQAVAPAGTGNNVAVLAGSIAGGLVAVTIVAMILLRHRSRANFVDYIKQRNPSREGNVIILPCKEDSDDEFNCDDATDANCDAKTDQNLSGDEISPPGSPAGITLAAAAGAAASSIHRRISSSNKVASTGTTNTNSHISTYPAAAIAMARSQSPSTPHSPPNQILSPPSAPSPIPMSPISTEDKSLAGSESDFTVNTEAGDSAALKSLSGHVNYIHGPSLFSSRASDGGSSGPASLCHTAESFERERPVNIRKDMLTSAWSGRIYSGRQVNNESVLQPSHFSASEERMMRTRQQELAANSTGNNKGTVGTEQEVDVVLVPNRGSASKNRDSVVFAQANENPDVVLIPPNQTHKSRLKRPGPEESSVV